MLITNLKRNFLGCFLVCLGLTGCFGGDHHTGEAKSAIRHSDWIVLDSQVSKDGRFSILAEENKVCVWDNETNEKRFECLTGPEVEGVELVGIAGTNGFFYTSNLLSISFFSMRDAKLVGTWTTGVNIIRDIAISDNGKMALLLLIFARMVVGLTFLSLPGS